MLLSVYSCAPSAALTIQGITSTPLGRSMRGSNVGWLARSR